MNTRTFKVLPKNEQDKLYKLYGNLDGFAHGYLNEKIKDDMTASYFDHWLDENEWALLDEVSESEHTTRRKHFGLFYKELSENCNVYSYRIHGRQRNKIQFRAFTSLKAMHKYLESSNPKKGKSTYPRLIIPDCNALIHEGYDYCLHIGFSEKNDISKILNLLENNGFHVLPHKE